MLSGLSIFLPAFNEENNIERCVKSALSNAKKIAKEYEVIVVLAKASSDGTENILKGLMRSNDKLRLVYQKAENKGYGAALKLGIESSRHDYIFYTDADNQYDMGEISKLLPHLKNYDIVSGYRIKRVDSIMRSFLALAYNILLRMMFRTGVKDVDSAFKIYKRKIFERITLNYSTGIVDAEIIIKARRSGFKIKEIGVHNYKRPAGKAMYEMWVGGMIKPKVVWELIKDIIRLWIELHKI